MGGSLAEESGPGGHRGRHGGPTHIGRASKGVWEADEIAYEGAEEDDKTLIESDILEQEKGIA